MNTKKTIVISLGGSIICPKAGEINTIFLKKFRKMILKFLGKGYKFVIVSGGGKICRLYQSAATKVAKLSNEDKDWLGIHATRLNAHLLRTIFRETAYPIVLKDPAKPIKKNWKLLIAGGIRPGWSTDYVSTLYAEKFKIKEIINAGNVSFVCDKDPAKYKNASVFKEITWNNYRKLISSKWTPGLSTPFDPVGAKLAEKLKIRVFMIKGTEIKNFEKALSGKKFKGTIIKP
ncbi:MAG: UMP kinase [Candidatus Paceibacterota bacterium]